MTDLLKTPSADVVEVNRCAVESVASIEHAGDLQASTMSSDLINISLMNDDHFIEQIQELTREEKITQCDE